MHNLLVVEWLAKLSCDAMETVFEIPSNKFLFLFRSFIVQSQHFHGGRIQTRLDRDPESAHRTGSGRLSSDAAEAARVHSEDVEERVQVKF